ncbi:MAG: glycosyltransferase [Deltaproteobacteria bacterium]|nr:glycosyltransferase [Deltaproteobacteria bacterium]MBN2688419.1 glycosyltransferase [Deltaproteobacteria bacterium]
MRESIQTYFSKAIWLSAKEIERPFVRHKNAQNSSGEIWHEKSEISYPLLSVIIPTSDAYRDGYFKKLLDQISRQNFMHFEVIVVRADKRQGRAINVGASLAKGEYIITLDDDTSLPDPETFSKLVAVMERYPEIGMAGGNNVIPEDASPFVRHVMKQIPRRSWEPVKVVTDSDLAEHPCLIMRTQEFKDVGGENELIPRGLDPYLRDAFRKMGKRVVVVPGVIYHHLPPDSLNKLLRQFYRNGCQAAYTNRKYPQWIIETPSTHGSFETHVLFPMRLLRFPLRLLKALITIKPILFLCEFSYAVGFVREWLLAKESND